MEGDACASMSPGAPPPLKREPEYLVDVSVKIEKEMYEDLEQLKSEPECVEPELECVKREPSWNGERCAEHGARGDKRARVPGPRPQVLQHACADKCPETPPSPEEDTKPATGIITNLQNPVAREIYMCDSCGNLFKNKRSLIRHIKAHLRANPKMLPTNFNKKVFVCEICSKRFFQSGHFNRHVRIHAAKKLYACDICKKEFTREDCLRLHKRIHTGHRPYSCTFCEKRFTQSHNLTRHVRTHTGEKPYACDICSKRCSQSGDLKSHMQVHQLGPAHACDACHRRFKHKSALRKHRRSHERNAPASSPSEKRTT